MGPVSSSFFFFNNKISKELWISVNSLCMPLFYIFDSVPMPKDFTFQKHLVYSEPIKYITLYCSRLMSCFAWVSIPRGDGAYALIRYRFRLDSSFWPAKWLAVMFCTVQSKMCTLIPPPPRCYFKMLQTALTLWQMLWSSETETMCVPPHHRFCIVGDPELFFLISWEE